MNRPSHYRAFTLIELLVVISIIVVLLALLTPALDQAIYQAELAVCGAQMKGIASGVTMYSADFKRLYPNRPRLDAVPSWQNNKFFDPAGARAVNGQDLRAIIRRYVATNAFLDPLVRKVEFAYPKATHGYSPYSIWFGWYYNGEPSRMRKIGDRFSWAGDTFDVIVSDWDRVGSNGARASAHPDSDGVMSNYSQDTENQEAYVPGGGGITYDHPTNIMSVSWWQTSFGVKSLGAMDLNFARADNSVSRYDAVTYDETTRGKRMLPVPWSRDNNPNVSMFWTHLPTR